MPTQPDVRIAGRDGSEVARMHIRTLSQPKSSGIASRCATRVCRMGMVTLYDFRVSTVPCQYEYFFQGILEKLKQSVEFPHRGGLWRTATIDTAHRNGISVRLFGDGGCPGGEKTLSSYRRRKQATDGDGGSVLCRGSGGVGAV